MACSNHLVDAFTINHIVFCVMFCFSLQVSVSSPMQIPLVGLGTDYNTIIRLPFSPAPELPSACCPWHPLWCEFERINGLLYVVQNERTFLLVQQSEVPKIPHSSESRFFFYGAVAATQCWDRRKKKKKQFMQDVLFFCLYVDTNGIIFFFRALKRALLNFYAKCYEC